jgi:hypothetical protein
MYGIASVAPAAANPAIAPATGPPITIAICDRLLDAARMPPAKPCVPNCVEKSSIPRENSRTPLDALLLADAMPFSAPAGPPPPDEKARLFIASSRENALPTSASNVRNEATAGRWSAVSVVAIV